MYQTHTGTCILNNTNEYNILSCNFQNETVNTQLCRTEPYENEKEFFLGNSMVTFSFRSALSTLLKIAL